MALFEHNYPLRIISTMPRSGTWYHQFLMGTYDCLARTGSAAMPTACRVFDSCDGLKLNIAVPHMKCPDFAAVYDGPSRSLWERTITVLGDPHRDTIAENPHLFSFTGNADLRVVYVFRNPLDQCVSWWEHLQNHIDPWRRSLAHGVPLRDWIRQTWINVYLHQYFTFHVMQMRFPERILMVPYETVLEDRQKALINLLKFFGVTPVMEYVERTLALTTKERLKAVERSQGHSLANDQVGAQQTHIRDGSVGRWCDRMNADDIEFISRRFAEFGLDLHAFRLMPPAHAG